MPEYCRKGHLRTPANTYTPPSGKRQCRECSGKWPAGKNAAGVDMRGYEGKIFTPKELAALRFLVRCMGCGAVPYENGEIREHTNQHGHTTELPVVVTDHADDCPVVNQSPRRGRPKVKVPKHKQLPCGDCQECGKPMTSSFGRPKKYCDDACRSAAKRARLKAGAR